MLWINLFQCLWFIFLHPSSSFSFGHSGVLSWTVPSMCTSVLKNLWCFSVKKNLKMWRRDQNRMAAILLTNSTYFFLWKMLYCESNFHVIHSKGPVKNKPALVQIMAGRWIGHKPLYESVMEYMCYSTLFCQYIHRFQKIIQDIKSQDFAVSAREIKFVYVFLPGLLYSRSKSNLFPLPT